jgi:hypothetical protein
MSALSEQNRLPRYVITVLRGRNANGGILQSFDGIKDRALARKCRQPYRADKNDSSKVIDLPVADSFVVVC